MHRFREKMHHYGDTDGGKTRKGFGKRDEKQPYSLWVGREKCRDKVVIMGIFYFEPYGFLEGDASKLGVDRLRKVRGRSTRAIATPIRKGW